MTTFRKGRLPLDPNAPKPDLTKHLRASGAQLSDACDYFSHITTWGMLGNDQWGDCTCAADGHIAMQQTAYGLGHAENVTDAEALTAYSAVSGFNADAGAPGANPTDRGATIQSALEYLRRKGVGGFCIAAYGHVEPKDHDAVRHALEEFGALSIGMDLPSSAMEQFDANADFDVVAGSSSDGGHCMMAAGFDTKYVYVVTWGKICRMTWAFWDAYVDEAWAVISEDWTSVTGLSLETFGAEFATAFGGHNPFVAPSFLQDVEQDALHVLSPIGRWFHKLQYRGDHA